MRPFPLSTAFTILATGITLAGAHWARPAIRGPELSQLRAVLDIAPNGVPMLPVALRPVPEHIPPLPIVGSKAIVNRLLDDSDGVLDGFYGALWRTERREKGAITRIVHYGDSPTTADLITGDVRSMLQKRFGWAGHGFILAAKPWAWYQHTGAELSGTGWQPSASTQFGAKDGLFGLGGVSFTSGSGARTRVVYSAGSHTRFEVWFLKQPGGGTLEVSADGQTLGNAETAAEAKEPGFATFTTESGARTVEIRAEGGPVRMFGVSAEGVGPGVVYDSLGLNGASIGVLTHMFNERHWAAELQHRAPALVIVNYGTNEADFGAFIDKQYEKELREAIRRIRAALPEASILVMSPMDRGQRGADGIETMATIPQLVGIQKRVAADTRCGFFDTYTAMGGQGTMAKWYAAQPRLVSADFIHPSPAGGKIVAEVFVREMIAGFIRYKARQVALR
jgi:lysophospholipase L1-like esterase